MMNTEITEIMDSEKVVCLPCGMKRYQMSPICTNCGSPVLGTWEQRRTYQRPGPVGLSQWGRIHDSHA